MYEAMFFRGEATGIGLKLGSMLRGDIRQAAEKRGQSMKKWVKALLGIYGKCLPYTHMPLLWMVSFGSSTLFHSNIYTSTQDRGVFFLLVLQLLLSY